MYVLLYSILGVGIVLIFPGRRLAHTLADPEEIDSTSVAYVESALEAWPDDHELRLRVAQGWIHSGEYARAKETIAPLLDLPGTDGMRARFLIVSVEREELLAIPPPERDPRRVEELMNDLDRIGQSSREIAQIEWLARSALLFEQPTRAAHLFERLADRDLHRRPRWLRQAAHWHVAAGNPVRASRLHTALAYETVDESEFSRAAVDAVNCLRAADEEGWALERIQEFMIWYPNNTKMLRKSIEISYSQNQPHLARMLGRKLVEVESKNRAVLSEQLERELSFQDLEAAVPLAQRMVDLDPSDEASREKLARYLTWLGRSEQALPHWTELTRQGDNPEYLTQALDLARALRDGETVIELLRREWRRRSLTPTQVIELARTHESLGAPELAEQAMVSYLAEVPNSPEVWFMLVRVQKAQGKLQAALETQQHLNREHSLTAEQILDLARTLSSLGDDSGALALLRDHRTVAPESNHEFWAALGQLAWEEELDTEALAAYENLWATGERTQEVAYRLIELLSLERRYEELLQVAEDAWRELDKDEFLLTALDAGSALARWSKVAELIEEAEARESEALTDERYWVVRARWRSAEGDLTGALAAYEEALRLDPADLVTRTGVLWMLVDADATKYLEHYVDRWRSSATLNRDYSGAYTSALRRLGRIEEAVFWYDRYARQHPDDLLWALEYATALEEAGRADSAWRLRRHLLPRAWRTARPLLAYSSSRTPGLTGSTLRAQSFALTREEERVVVGGTRLVREHLGNAAGDEWLRRIEQGAEASPYLREFVVEQHLATGLDERAREWQLRSRTETHANLDRSPASKTSESSKTQPQWERLPRWERLSLAIRAEDLGKISNNLEGRGEPNPEIGRTDEIEGLRRVGRDDEAISLSLDRLWERSTEVDHDNRTLLRQATQLLLRHPRAARADQNFESLGNLDWSRSVIETTYSANTWTLDFQLAETALESRSRNYDISGRDQQTDLAARAHLWTDRSRHTVRLGYNDDRNDPLPSASYQLGYQVISGLSAQLELVANQISEDGDALRVAGAVDRARAGLALDITPREYVTTALTLSQYHDRTRDPIARGVAAQLEVGHRFHIAERQIVARAFGSVTANQVGSSLSAPWTEILGPNVDPETVVPEEFSIIGVGLTLRHGTPGAWSPDSDAIRYFVDVSTGWLMPTNEPTFSVRLGIGFEVFGRDELSFRAHYGESQGGLENQDFSGLSVRYVYRFGR